MEFFYSALFFIESFLLLYYMLAVVPRLRSEKKYELRMKEVFNELYQQQIDETEYWRDNVMKKLMPGALDFPPMDEKPDK